MKRQNLSHWLAYALLASLPLAASAQCDPGPGTGHSVNRCYDDGYVYVDSSGNAGGYTWYWGYQSSSQIQNGYIMFHSRTNLDANTLQVLTDTYGLGGLAPPAAPYPGTFQGPGPLIPDTPVSRSIKVITLPILFIKSTATNSVVISWPSPSATWALQQNGDLNTTNWTDVLIAPDNDGTNNSVVVSPAVGSEFYRLNMR
jgi:hypothetical protein